MIQVFALEKHLEFINKVETGSIALGIAKILGNKGATSVRLNLYNMPTCFVNLHLAAHEKGFNERLDQMLYAERYQSFTKTEVDTIFKNDLVFWLGDLNFRLHQDLNLSVEDIKDHIREKQLDKLFEHDEINRMMKNGGFFQKLQEADIKFPPSFKFKLGTNDYVTNRRPAWTDRILYRDSEKVNITPISYKSVEEYMVSDHKPVIGEFEISIKVYSLSVRL
ncbi:phosphatidylinositol 4,5-bisphosphate 5-phosphatase A-like [Macrosteles quadrilineatus]|nr:phosphatidylinositol 4,5-bisphosphate 5-phosphatase A-like [Macrosteles quadrilineatus]